MLLDAEPEQLITTALVVAEAGWLIERQLGGRAEAAFYASIAAGELVVHPLLPADWERVAELTETYADNGLGGVDSSLVAAAERLDITMIARLTSGTSASSGRTISMLSRWRREPQPRQTYVKRTRPDAVISSGYEAASEPANRLYSREFGSTTANQQKWPKRVHDPKVAGSNPAPLLPKGTFERGGVGWRMSTSGPRSPVLGYRWRSSPTPFRSTSGPCGAGWPAAPLTRGSGSGPRARWRRPSTRSGPTASRRQPNRPSPDSPRRRCSPRGVAGCPQARGSATPTVRELLSSTCSHIELIIASHGDGQGIAQLLRAAVATGLPVRVILGTLVRAVEPLLGIETLEIRASVARQANILFRVDDEMLLVLMSIRSSRNAAPVIHLRRRVGGGLFDRLVDDFDANWLQATARPTQSSWTRTSPTLSSRPRLCPSGTSRYRWTRPRPPEAPSGSPADAPRRWPRRRT